MRRDEEHIVERELMTDKAGRRKKGRPKTRWNDVCRRDMNTVGISAVEAINRATRIKKITSLTWLEEKENHQPLPCGVASGDST